MATSKRDYPVCLLGAMAAGKSSFLAGLAIRGGATQQSSLTIHGNDPASVDYLTELADALRLQQWPSPTNRAERFSFEVNCGGRILTLSILDFPGGDFLNHLRRLDKDRGDELKRHLREAEACLLLLDPHVDLRPVGELSGEEHNRLHARFDAYLQAVSQLRRAEAGVENAIRPASKAKGAFPDVALVVAKADSVPELAAGMDPAKFVESRAPSFLRRLQENYHAPFEVFAVSSVGATEVVDGRTVPARHDRLAPTGYEPLFEWLARRRKVRRMWPYFVGAAAALATVAVVAGGWTTQKAVERSSIESALQDVRLSPRDRLRQSIDAPSPLWRLRAQLLDEDLSDVEKKLESSGGEADLASVKKELDELATLQPGPAKVRIDALQRKVAERRDDGLFAQVKGAFEGRRADFVELAGLYLKQYSANAQRREQVVAWLRDERAAGMRRARQLVSLASSTTPQELQDKAKAILDFLETHGPALEQQPPRVRDEMKRMRRAAELARQFSEPRPYRVTLVKTGPFTSPRYQIFEVHRDGALEQEFRSTVAATEIRWDKPFELSWSATTKLRLVLKEDGRLYDSNVAELPLEGPDGLAGLTGSHSPKLDANWRSSAADLKFEFTIDGLSSDDWKAFSDYVHPGDRWSQGGTP